MAVREVNIDLVNANRLSKLVDWRMNPLTSAEMTTLTGLIGSGQTGLTVWNTDESFLYFWTGAAFIPFLPHRITQVNSNTTLAFNTHRIVECIASNLQITLPSAVGKAGVDFVVKQSNFTNTRILTTSSQTIDGSTSITLNNPYESRTLVSNNTNWIIV